MRNKRLGNKWKWPVHVRYFLEDSYHGSFEGWGKDVKDARARAKRRIPKEIRVIKAHMNDGIHKRCSNIVQLQADIEAKEKEMQETIDKMREYKLNWHQEMVDFEKKCLHTIKQLKRLAKRK
jgi:hypothetical protein